MNDKLECKKCGYTLRKNSKRILIDTHIEITINNDTLVYDILLCNECKDDLEKFLQEIVEE